MADKFWYKEARIRQLCQNDNECESKEHSRCNSRRSSKCSRFYDLWHTKFHPLNLVCHPIPQGQSLLHEGGV